jgi:hypothetical protein
VQRIHGMLLEQLHHHGCVAFMQHILGS